MNNNSNSFSFGGGRGEDYCSPSIKVIRNVYNEGLMQAISLPVGTTDPNACNGGSGAKPCDDWGNIWNELGDEDENHTW